MVLPAVEHANESLKWYFAAEHGAVNDVSTSRESPLPYIDLSVEQTTDCARIWLYIEISGYFSITSR